MSGLPSPLKSATATSPPVPDVPGIFSAALNVPSPSP